MTIWNKNPDKFPPEFLTVLEGQVDRSMGEHPSFRAAWRKRQHFYAFRSSVRKKAHKLRELELEGKVMRTRIREVEDGVWELSVSFHERCMPWVERALED